MASAGNEVLLRHIHRLVDRQASASTPDGELIERFTTHDDEPAFEALLRRHGPMVLRVCQRVLWNPQDAEDAFQATFLLLARKAASVRRKESVGSWLYGVAYRVALSARAAAARRFVHERQVAALPAKDPLTEITLREAQRALDAELNRLAEKYRAPLVLCCLEGMTRDEAARQLGISLTTLKSRLERARQLLRARLTRRGLAFSAALSAILLGEAAAQADLPAVLASSTIQVALGRTLNGIAGSSPPSQTMLRLVEGVLRAMLVLRLKVCAGVVLALAFFVAGAGMVAHNAAFLQARPIQSKQIGEEADRLQAETTRQVRTDLYGDALPDSAISRLGTTRLRHGVFVSWLQFTPDGKSLISQGGDGVRIWNTATGAQRHFLPNESSANEQMPYEGSSLSSDGKLLAYPGNSSVHLWDIAAGKRLRTLETGPITCARFSPDAKLLAVQKSKAKPWPFELWDVARGELLRAGGEDPSFFHCLQFSHDGKMLITAGSRFQRSPPESNYQIRFWETATGKELHHFDLGTANPLELAVSPDGQRLGVICRGDRGTENCIRIWDISSGKETCQLVPTAKGFTQQTYYSTALVFAQDGRTLYTGGLEGHLFAWDPASGKELRRIGTGFLSPRALAVSQDNKTLAADVAGEAIRLIDAQTGKDLFADIGHRFTVLRMAVTPDGRTAVTGDAFHVFVWNTMTGRMIRSYGGDDVLFNSIQLGLNGAALLSTEQDRTRQVQTLRVRELATGKELQHFEWRRKENDPLGFVSFSLDNDGKTVTVTSRGKAVMVIDLETGKERRLAWPASGDDSQTSGKLGDGVFIYGATSTPDGRTSIVWDSDHVIHLRDKATQRETGRFTFSDEGGPPRAIPIGGLKLHYDVHAMQNGRMLAICSKNGFLALHDLATGRLVRKIDSLAHNPGATVFSPDERSVAWAGGSVIHLIELATGRERHRFMGHAGQVTSLVFSADSKILVSGSDDTTALVWDLTGRREALGSWPQSLSAFQLDACWSDLARDDAGPAFRAMRKLASSPSETVAYLDKRMTPVPAVPEKRLDQLVKDLDSDNFKARQNATGELDRLGELALVACRAALADKPSLEVRQRLQTLLAGQEQAWWSLTPDRLRMLRSIEILERTGTIEARRLLARLAKGAPSARLTEEAQASLQRSNNK